MPESATLQLYICKLFSCEFVFVWASFFVCLTVYMPAVVSLSLVSDYQPVCWCRCISKCVCASLSVVPCLFFYLFQLVCISV